MDGTGDRGRTASARHRGADFAPACRPPAQKGGLQPHRFRYWLTEVADSRRDEKIVEGCEVYAQAPERAKGSERSISMDELTGGHVIEPSWGPTRTEEDALAHLQRLIGSSPTATKWHVVLDNLNIHQSESLVRWVAQREGVAAETLGIKGKSGILQSMESRAAFLHDPTHQV